MRPWVCNKEAHQARCPRGVPDGRLPPGAFPQRYHANKRAMLWLRIPAWQLTHENEIGNSTESCLRSLKVDRRGRESMRTSAAVGPYLELWQQLAGIIVLLLRLEQLKVGGHQHLR